MNILTIVLMVPLGLFFLLFVFLAVRPHETDRHEIFPASPGPFADGSEVLTSQKLCEKCFEVALQGPPATYEEHLPRSPSEQIGTSVSHDLFNGKVTMMNTHIDAKKQGETAAHTETIVTDMERLTGYGFTSEEIVSLLWLQKWYQTGGSDRVELVRHWEFLHLLVLNGKLDV